MLWSRFLHTSTLFTRHRAKCNSLSSVRSTSSTQPIKSISIFADMRCILHRIFYSRYLVDSLNMNAELIGFKN